MCRSRPASGATGRVNLIYAAAIIAFGALFQDTVYYWLGRLTKKKPKIKRFAERAKLLRDTVRPVEEAWKHNMFATLMGSKFAYGL